MKSKKPSSTVPYNVQVDADQLKRARELVDLPSTFRALVENVTKTKICPCCGTKLAKRK